MPIDVTRPSGKTSYPEKDFRVKQGVRRLVLVLLMVRTVALVVVAVPCSLTARAMTIRPAYTWRTVTVSPPAPLFYDAAGIASGSSGNLFVADRGDHRIEKFSPTGVPLASWGTDTPGPLRFDGPRAIAVDTDGNVYVADNGVVKLSATGQFLARWGGPGLAGAQGLAVDVARNVYVLSTRSIPHSSSFDRITITELSHTGIRLRTMVYGFDRPFGALGTAMTVAPNRNLLLSLALQRHCHDCNGTYYVLRIISPGGRILSDAPEDIGGNSVAVSKAGDVYLAASHKIERLTSSGALISAFGSAGCSPTELGADLRMVVSPVGAVYVADSQITALRPDGYPAAMRTGVLHQFTADGSDPDLHGSCPTAGARTHFGQINDVAVGTRGRIYVADGVTSTIDRIGANGSISNLLVATHPSTVATDRQGNYYISNLPSDMIEQHAPDGRLLTTRSARLVESMAIAPNSNVYALTALGEVVELPPVGHGSVPLRRWRMVGYAGRQGGLDPRGICLDGAGNVWVTDTRHNNVQKFSSAGRLLLIWGRGGSGRNHFQNPSGVTVDGRGHLFVLDSGNNRVQEYDLRGHFIATYGREGQAPGELRSPQGISADQAGNIYVGDRGNDRIQQLLLR